MYLDGIAHTAPFVYDTLVGFNHTIEARNQTVGATTYNFRLMVRRRCAAAHHRRAGHGANLHRDLQCRLAAPLAFVQVERGDAADQPIPVTVTYANAQVAGDTNILAIGWNNATSNITSVTDSAGNVYQLAVPTARGTGISQAIYYASNIKAAAAGANTVTVTFNTATPFVDVRATEYSGLDPVNPFDVGTSASGTSATANSGSVTTTAARELDLRSGHHGRRVSRRPGRTSPVASSPRPTSTLRKTGSSQRRALQRDRAARRHRRLDHASRRLQSEQSANRLTLLAASLTALPQWHKAGAKRSPSCTSR